MQKLSFRGILIVMALALGGCADSGFKASVTRFHDMPAPSHIGQGEGILIEPLNPENAGLQFTAYADLVGQQLGKLGYQPAKDVTPDIIARIDYSITEQVGVQQDKGPRIGIGVGGGGRHMAGSLGTSFSLGGGPKPVYLARLALVLQKRENGQRLFEGKAENLGTNPDLSAVMPFLVEALFTNFPGVSGSSETIKIEGKK